MDPALRLVGSGGDTSVPDPLHPQCIITFHCDQHGAHCTSTSSCAGSKMSFARGAGKPAVAVGAGLSSNAISNLGVGVVAVELAAAGTVIGAMIGGLAKGSTKAEAIGGLIGALLGAAAGTFVGYEVKSATA